MRRGNARSRACRSSSSSHRIGPSSARFCLPRRSRCGVAAGPAGAAHVRGHAGVRARHWWERVLYNQSAKRLRAALLGRPHTVIVNVPYRREDPETERPARIADDDEEADKAAGD